MKKMGRNSFWNLCFLSVTAGVLTGTIWANLLGGELLGQIGYFDGIWRAGQTMDEGERRLMWRYVLAQRLWEAGFGGLLAMTPLAAPGYLLLAFGGGFALASIITVFTLEKGAIGLVCWLASAFPQGLCYLGGWAVWTAAVGERQDLKKVRVWLLVGVLTVAGSLLEVWVNPLLANLIL